MGLKLLSINAQGLNHPDKHQSLWQEAQKHKADILTVQETNFHLNATPKCSHPNYSHIFTASALTKKRGILISIRASVSFELKDSVIDPGGRYIILPCVITNLPLTLVSVYAHNSHQMRFLRTTFCCLCLY